MRLALDFYSALGADPEADSPYEHLPALLSLGFETVYETMMLRQYASTLEHYAALLRETGSESEAESLAARAESLRESTEE